MKELFLRWIACVAMAVCNLSVLAEESSSSVTIPITFNHQRIMVSATINGSKPLLFLLDNGCTIPTLNPALVEELRLERAGTIRMIGIAGEERAPTYRGAVYNLAGATYAPRRVAALPSERKRGRRRDGVLDAGLFQRFVVEISPKQKTIRLHQPATFHYTGSGKALPLRFREEAAIIAATLVLGDGSEVTKEFEVDTGCDSGVCLGSAFVERHRLVDADRAGSQKFGIGGSVETKSGTVPLLRLGTIELRQPQTDFFLQGSPVDEPMAGHIGMGVLHQFTVIFDYSRSVMIIEE